MEMNYHQKYLKYKAEYLYLKQQLTLNQQGGERTKIKYTKLDLVDYPSTEYDSVEHQFRELYKVCEPEEKEDFEPYISPSNVIVGYNPDGPQGFLVITETSTIQEKHPDGFEEAGGLPGKKGLFITSVCGNITRFYGFLKPLFEKLDEYSAENEIDYLLLHVSAARPHIQRKYEGLGFEQIGDITQNGQDFIVMRKMMSLRK